MPAAVFVEMLRLYTALGLVFAIAFPARGVSQIDVHAGHVTGGDGLNRHRRRSFECYAAKPPSKGTQSAAMSQRSLAQSTSAGVESSTGILDHMAI